jgi:hypothetical protein
MGPAAAPVFRVEYRLRCKPPGRARASCAEGQFSAQLLSSTLLGVGWGWTRKRAMPRENNVAKQRKIGERLSRAMVEAHMGRAELAALTGYSEAQIMRWELGRSVLYPTELIKLCHALDVMPEWLLCWEKRQLH